MGALKRIICLMRGHAPELEAGVPVGICYPPRAASQGFYICRRCGAVFADAIREDEHQPPVVD